MLSQDFEISDLMSYDPYLKSSLEYINTNLFDHNSMNIHFNVMDKQIGNIELVQNGSDLTVNNYNKQAYVKMFLEYYGFHKTKEQIRAFLDGLREVIPAKLLNLLTIEDLEKLLIGARDIDIEDWKRYTRYTGENAHYQHESVHYFWRILSQMTQNQLRKFLQFCTGCRSVPIEGFKSLKNNRQEECLFTINVVKTKHDFIRAHTCFNRIDLPELSCKHY
jgi:E3 ubiquitin-protein ligase NEDD4